MKGINITTTDPTYNLAVEEALFDSLSSVGEEYFLLWQNAPSVIVGRHQNTLEEADQFNKTFDELYAGFKKIIE